MPIPATVLAEAQALRRRGHSIRAIARALSGKISRGTLALHLHAEPTPPETTIPDDLGIPTAAQCRRCPRCHRLVIMPCLACTAEFYHEAARRAEPRNSRTAKRPAKPSDIPLIHRIRRARRLKRLGHQITSTL